jgi:hypothetical protein
MGGYVMLDYDFSAALERVMQAAGVTTQTGLAVFLGVSQSSVWDAMKRGEGIPAGWLVTMTERYGISPCWIKTGEEPQFFETALQKMSAERLLSEVGRRFDAWRGERK